jgi:hypothetical protein
MIRSLWLGAAVFCLTAMSVASCSADSPSQPLASDPAQPQGDLVLVDHGHSKYEIVRDVKGPESVQVGAMELQRLIEKGTGAKLPVVDKPTAGREQIVVGADALAKEAGISAEKLPLGGFRMIAKGPRVFLIGHDETGPLDKMNTNKTTAVGSYFAANEFAREFLHVNWYMPTDMGEEVPHLDVLRVPANLDVTEKPALERRMILSTMSYNLKVMERDKKEGKIKTGTYVEQNNIEATKWGRRMRLGNDAEFHVSHSWFQWMPAEEPNQWSPEAYGKTHPEWYALVTKAWGPFKPGDRETHYVKGSLSGQLCVSNEAMRTQFAANIIAYAKKTGEHNFSLSPNDGGVQCDCDECRKWGWGTEPNQGHPTMTDRMIRFANDIAQRVKKEIPDAQFGFYAYADYATPPTEQTVDPSITISFVRNMMPFYYFSPNEKEVIEKNILGWQKKVSRMNYTSYYTGYGFWSLPWSTPDVQGWWLETMTKYPSAMGCFLAYAPTFDPMAMGVTGPDAWVTTRLMWDPTQSVTALETEWYQGCFGPDVAPIIQEYFKRIHDSMAKTIQADPFHRVTQEKGYVIPCYAPIRKQCRELIDRAAALSQKMPARYQWRVDRIARGWKLAELTLDALDAAQAAKDHPSDQALQKAAREATQARWNLLHDPASQFALMPNAVEDFDKRVPLPIVTNQP